MATIRVNDFAFVFRGGVKFNTKVDVTPAESFSMSLLPWQTRVILTKSNRNRFIHENGSERDLESELIRLMDFIFKKTNNRLDTIGTCCIVGMSNGAALALALASELSKNGGPPELTYVGTTNVPMFPFGGRDPMVPNVGKLQPWNGPDDKATAVQCGVSGTCNSDNKWNAPDVRLGSLIKAKIKRNFYEVAGNHMKWTGNRPPETKRTPDGKFDFSNNWWWKSDIAIQGVKTNEVHGTLNVETGDWTNIEKFVNPHSQDDEMKHEELCLGQGFQDMLDEASKAFADFPV